MRSVTASAPATLANLGPGFDIAGMAIEGFRDKVSLELTGGEAIELELIGSIRRGVAAEPERNSAVVAASKVLELAGKPRGFRLKLHKGVPIGIGLGSSGASAAAAAYAANAILGTPLSMEELVKCAAEGERVACGAPHLDNVAPSLYGGFTIILDVEKPEILNIKPRKDFKVVIVTPEVRLPENKTEYARRILPKMIGLETVVRQQASLARLIASILTGNLEMMGRAVSGDLIVEPARSIMIPGFREAKEAALKAGALGFSISGAGPSVFAVTKPNDAEKVAEKITEAINKTGTKTSITITKPSIEGARIE